MHKTHDDSAGKKEVFLRGLFLVVLIACMVIQANAIDYPHFGINNIGCDSCHFISGTQPSLLPPWTSHEPLNIDDTQFNTLCWSCHNDVDAPHVKTHSSLQTDNGYGDWTVQCKDCHDPHYQKQFRTYGSSSYLYSGVSTGITASTLTKTGAGWTENAYQKYILYPNVSQKNYQYEILSNTSDTITVQGPINLTKATTGNTFGITYGNPVKSTIATPNSGNKAVRFFSGTGNKSFADGDGIYDGICEVCHTQTTYHRNSAAGNHTHNTSSKCTDCHNHANGFKGAGCDSCHGYPPVADNATGGPDGLVNLPGVTGSVTAGAHEKHVNTKLYVCSICHYNSVGDGDEHNNGAPQDITMGFNLFGGAYLGGIYDGQTTVNYDSSEVNTVVISGGTKTCSNIYCHGELPNGTVWGGGKATNPAWDGSVTCSSCHDSGGASSDLSGRHGKHTDASRHATHCEKCHYDTASGSSSIKTESFHVNNSKDINLSAGGSFNSGTKACISTYCHSDARGGVPNVPVAWSDSTPMQCDSCHNGRTGVDTLEMNSNGHHQLVSSDWIRQYPCYYCHDATMDNAGNIKDYTKHSNETKDVVMSSNWNITGLPAASYNPATKVCDNVYCHSDGTTVNPEIRPFAWTEEHAKCNTCHGHALGSCTDCHSDGITGWVSGEEWKSAMPMYANSGAGTERANAHNRHLLTDYNCDKCHAGTIVGGSCTTCHDGGTPPGNMTEFNHINPTYHVNKIKDVAFSGGGTYSQVNKTCSNTSCHTGADPQWGDSVDNAVLCLECHGSTVSDADDFTASNGTRAKINTVEWVNTGHGRTAASGNYESGNPPADFPGNPCWYCHDNDVLHDDATNPFRLSLHDQFYSRFNRECVYCHMEGLDSECLDCHNDGESMAPQLAEITAPPFSQDHTGYTDGLTSCVSVCHDTDEEKHNTGAGLWTSAQKADVQNQYVMMGVCLVCHDDDSNGKCTSCHTGPQYALGFDPGSGLVSAVSKATSTHFGYKHYEAYENNGVWKGGKFCWDCHDPHGDSNIYMVQNKVATETDGTFGIPVTRRDVVFTRKQNGLDYVKTSAPFNGICNVCHEQAGQHYRFDYGDGHMSGRICTTCHEHRFTDSHASGKACNECHQNKPIARHEAFGQPRDCTKCHEGVINKRVDIMGQLRSNSHHIQGVDVTNKHCYACHWEANDVGLIDVDYHEGYNNKTHASTKDAKIDLVIWGPGTRPTDYDLGTTAVTFTATKIGTVDERAEVTKVTDHCLSCHSDQNNEVQPFNVVDPENGDCKTPRQYAWDRTSIAARYSQAGTTTWGKYTGTANAAKKISTKAFSAHGNAVANQGGWSATTGLDDVIPNTRDGSQNVQCFDCHSSHGSKTTGTTSSYITFNNTYNGANLKETQAGKGGYNMTYKAAANTSGVNPYNAGAAQCFDCHETAASGSKPWGYNSTYGASQPIMGYQDTPKFGQGTKGSMARFAYRANKATILGGHLKTSSALKGLDGVAGTGDEAQGTINGLCTPCHDPHGVSPSLGANQQYAVPLLKGTWMTSPYKEDYPAPNPSGTNSTAKSWGRYRGHPGTAPISKYNIDRTTFGGSNRISEDDTKFAGLCLMCHPKSRLTDGTNKNQNFKTLDRIHESVNGWSTNTEHSYPCSKCHQPHNSGLPRLMQTNCLDYNHRGQRVSGGEAWRADSQSGSAHGHGEHRGYPIANVLGNSSSQEATSKCHSSAPLNAGSWPSKNYWNNVTPW